MARSWTSQRSGNFNLDSTDPASPWYDGGTQTGYAAVPGDSGNANADCFTIADGHTVTGSGNRAVGDPASPSTYAMRTAGTGGTGVLNWTSGILTIQSNALVANAVWAWSAGAGFTFDHASTKLTFQQTDGSSQNNCGIQFNGASGNRCTVSSTNQPGSFTKGAGNSMSPIATYTDFSNIGDASTDAWTYAQNQASSTAEWSYCNFSACGQVRQSVAGATNSSTIIRYNKFTSSAGSIAFALQSTTAIGTGTRLIRGNSIDKQAGNATNWRDFSIKGNYFGGPISTGSTSDNPAVEFENNFFHLTSSTGFNIACVVSSSNSNYIFCDNGATAINAAKPITVSGQGSYHQSNWIFDCGNTNSACDMFSVQAPASAQTVNFTSNLVLPNAAGVSPGNLIGAGGGANLTISVTHNTYCVQGTTDANGLQLGETYIGRKGYCIALRDNLGWTPPGQTAGMHFQYFSVNGPGTLGATNGSTSFTGSGTSYTSYADGMFIVVNADATAYQISGTPGSATTFTAATPYAGTTGTGKTYKVLVKDQIWNASFAAANYNAGWGLGTGTNGPGYNSATAGVSAFTYTLGSNDVTLGADPFVDRFRNLATFAVHKGLADVGDTYATKTTAARAYLWDDPETRIAELTAWVKEGFNVTSSALQGTASDGTDIGARPFVASTGGLGASLIIIASYGSVI